MSPAMEELYQYFVGHPNPRHWPEELRDSPVLGHGQYAFSEGLRLGFLLAVECMARSYCGPKLPSFQCLRHRPMYLSLAPSTTCSPSLMTWPLSSKRALHRAFLPHQQMVLTSSSLSAITSR